MSKVSISAEQEELEMIWKLRDNAKTEKEREKAQKLMDEHFFGKPEKKGKKKKKVKRKQEYNDDDYYDDEWEGYE